MKKQKFDWNKPTPEAGFLIGFVIAFILGWLLALMQFSSKIDKAWQGIHKSSLQVEQQEIFLDSLITEAYIIIDDIKEKQLKAEK